MNQPIKLTLRERQVIERLIQGKSNKQIAEELSVSAETVKKYMKSIFAKFGVRNRTETAKKAKSLHESNRSLEPCSSSKERNPCSLT